MRAGLSADLGPSRKQGLSEDKVEAEADAPLGDARIGRVGEASDVVDLKHLEDVVDAHDQFEVGLVGHDVRPLGQLPQVRAQTVFGERGVVLRRQMAPEALEGHILAELQSAQERDAVEEFARQVPGEVELEVAVVDELHVLHEVERPWCSKSDVLTAGRQSMK